MVQGSDGSTFSCQAARDTPESQRLHKPFCRVAGNMKTITLQLSPYFPCAVYFVVFFPYAPDLESEVFVALPTPRCLLRMLNKAFQPIVGRGSDRQFLADRLDSQDFAVLVDEGYHHFCKQSSFALA